MKTLILLLSAALAAPALAQTDYDTETVNSTTNSTTVSRPSGEAPATNESSTMDSSTTGAITDRSGSSTNMNATAPAATTAPSATSPTMMAPTTTTSEETTSRTYTEDTGMHRRLAGFYIEPGIVGTREDADIKSSLVGSDRSGNANSVSVDLKLGGHINDMFFAGADGRYGRSRFENTSYQDTDATSWNWGPTVGLNTPYFGGRVWASYIVDGNYNPDQGANGVDLNFKDPYGWRVGGGIRLSNVSLNLEYEDLTYRTTDFESVGTLAANTAGTDFAQRGYSLSLSFPIDL